MFQGKAEALMSGLRRFSDFLALCFLDLYLILSGYRICLAESYYDRKVAYGIRWQVFSDAGYFTENFSVESCFDRYDNHSAIFLVYFKSTPIGTLRLTYGIELGMAINDFFNINFPKESMRMVEIGKFCVLREFREHRRLASLTLVRAAQRWSRRHGVFWWIGFASEALLKSFNGFVKYEKLSQFPLSSQQKRFREDYQGYFAQKIIPFLIGVNDISANSGLRRKKRMLVRSAMARGYGKK